MSIISITNFDMNIEPEIRHDALLPKKLALTILINWASKVCI